MATELATAESGGPIAMLTQFHRNRSVSRLLQWGRLPRSRKSASSLCEGHQPLGRSVGPLGTANLIADVAEPNDDHALLPCSNLDRF